MVKISEFPIACRLCAKAYHAEKLVKIFSSRGTSLNLKESVNAHLPIKVAETDLLPLNVCIKCIRRLNATNEFYDVIVGSDKLFKKLLKKKEDKRAGLICEQNESTYFPIKKKDGEIVQKDCSAKFENINQLVQLPQFEENVTGVNNQNQSTNDTGLKIDSVITEPNCVIVSTSTQNEKTEMYGTVVPSISLKGNVSNLADSECYELQNQLECIVGERKTVNKMANCLATSKNGTLINCLRHPSINFNCNVSEKVSGDCNIQIPIDNDNGMKKSKYLHMIQNDANDILSNNVNGNGNVVINVSNSNVHASRDQCTKLPMEVLCCPDCKETAKIFSLAERQLFYEYLKQHCCNKISENENAIKTFSKYKESHGMKKSLKERKRESLETGEPVKTSTRVWPDGDLPADPGPDPILYENIFEGNVRLDDDFHWPMPKRMRRLHKCNSCEFVTKSAVRLKTHQRLHRIDKNRISLSSCRHCHKQFDTSNEAKKHERLIHITVGAKNSLCEYCGVMKPQKTLKDHILKQHTVESEIEMQECDICGKSFISPTSLYLHKKTHTIERQHLCDLCGKAFKQRIAMRRHYLLHFPRAPPKFKCNICEKSVTTRGSLRLHMMRHTGEKPQECPECHMVMRHGLKHHMRLHSDDSPFKCVVCGADFKRRDYVRRHMRKHLNETQNETLQCTICNYIFDDIKNFLIHHRDIHNNEIFTQIKIYECKNCSMQFADAVQHKDHEEFCGATQKEIQNKSYNSEERSCIIDGYNRDCSSNDLQKHRTRNSGIERPYPCTYCDYRGSTKMSLMEHTRKHMNERERPITYAISEQKFQNQCDPIRFHQNRCKLNQEMRRTKSEEPVHEQQHNEHVVILSEDVMSLDTGSSEYPYINVIEKQNLRGKDMLLSMDEQIMTNSSVGVFESPVEQFTPSPHPHLQPQLCLHPNSVTYTRESLSWKQL